MRKVSQFAEFSGLSRTFWTFGYFGHGLSFGMVFKTPFWKRFSEISNDIDPTAPDIDASSEFDPRLGKDCEGL